MRCSASRPCSQRSAAVGLGCRGLLGLAIANKEWALLAVGPVLLALPAHRWRALAIAGATAALFYAPLLIAQIAAHGSIASLSASNTGATFQPWQIWWFLGATGHVVRDTGDVDPGRLPRPAGVALECHAPADRHARVCR